MSRCTEIIVTNVELGQLQDARWARVRGLGPPCYFGCPIVPVFSAPPGGRFSLAGCNTKIRLKTHPKPTIFAQNVKYLARRETSSHQMWLFSKIYGKISAFLAPSKWAKRLSEFLKFVPPPNVWYTFDGLSRTSESGCKKNERHDQNKGLPTIVGRP